MPCSVLRPNASTGWSAGWYLVQGAGWQTEPASPAALRLRAMYIQGATDNIPLTPVDSKGALSCVVLLKYPCGDLSIECEGYPATAQVEHLSLRPIGRLEAATRMLMSLLHPKGRRDWRLFSGSLGKMFIAALRGDLTRSGEVLLWHYHASIGAHSSTEPADASFVPCGLGTRLFWPGTIQAELRPVRDLRAHADEHGFWEWETTGEDPQFRLALPGGISGLLTGWYLVSGHLEIRSGRILAPCLYPAYGHEEAPGSMIRLPEPDYGGKIHGLVLLKYDASGLRFDPTTRHARFVIRQFRIERIARFTALMVMLDGNKREDGRQDWPALARECGKFVATAYRLGLRPAADVVRDSYERRLLPNQPHYDDWVKRYDTLTPADINSLEQRAASCPATPLISILLPVYETPECWLRRCLDSVLQQAYQHWELCIADDASPSAHVRKVLREYEKRDIRIHVTYRSRNGHIAEASATALAMARGGYIALLDHDDELRPHALLEVAETIVAKPHVELIYSDEDKLDQDGRRCQPYFKPDWNPDLLLSQNYICHFTVIRTDRVRAVGGFRKGFEGSQDHDLILRCTEGLGGGQIHHIPKVLYHWRAIAGSTALERGAKDYASNAGALAVTDHLRRTGANATVSELAHGHYRVHWPVPDPAPKVCLLIPTRDKVELLRRCIDSLLRRTRYRNFEIVVVDNQSSEPAALAYLDELGESGAVKVLEYDAPFNYSAINNWAAAQCDGELLCLLNNDIEVISEGWLDEMVGNALRPEVGAVGALLYYPDDTIQHAGVILGLGGVANHAYVGKHAGYAGHGARALVAQNLSAVTGACLVVRRSVYEQVGGLDERLQVAFNDIDFCLRLVSAGYRNVWTPFAKLYHHESASRGVEDTEQKIRRFQDEAHFMEKTWGELLQHDPAYNPNFSLQETGFEFAQPRA